MSILGLGIENPGIECQLWAQGLKVWGSNVHFGLGDRMYWNQMSIFGSEIKSPGINCPGIECPGIECPFWAQRSKVWGLNVHFWLGDRKSGDQMSGDRMSIFGFGIKCPFWTQGAKVRGSNVRGSNVHFGVGDRKSRDQMSRNRMSILGSGIKSPGIEWPF